MLADDLRWNAVCARDARADGTFYFSVATTGIYCRPSCGARRPKRENVAFHNTTEDAERAGFRTCKRCHPQGPSGEQQRAAQVKAMCRFIENAATPPSLDELAAHVRLSPTYAQRMFTAKMGVSPKVYAHGLRAERLRQRLPQETSVTRALYDAGFGSSSGFYAQAPHTLGMTPTAFRAGGRGEQIEFAVAPCSLGFVLAATTPRGLCAVFLGDDVAPLEADLRRRFPRARLMPAQTGLEALIAHVVDLVERPGMAADIPLDARGTAFQQRVWKALTAIPAGSTVSYGALAQALGTPSAVRAVAQACGANPLAVVVPCHRVVGADGKLTGYRWGVERKRALLAREKKS